MNKDDIIDNLAEALLDCLLWNYVEYKQPPYRVPCAIMGDLWRWQTTGDKQEAYDIIRKAVNAAAGKSERPATH